MDRIVRQLKKLFLLSQANVSARLLPAILLLSIAATVYGQEAPQQKPEEPVPPAPVPTQPVEARQLDTLVELLNRQATAKPSIPFPRTQENKTIAFTDAGGIVTTVPAPQPQPPEFNAPFSADNIHSGISRYGFNAHVAKLVAGGNPHRARMQSPRTVLHR
jgi:hypothetical protein